MVSADLKPMRKGTRSCRECRRRKTKCIWTSSDATVCNDCLKHKRECQAQGYVLDRSGVAKRDTLLKIKVNRIESMVERLAKLQDEQSVVAPRDENGCSFQRVQQGLLDGSELAEHATRSSPLFGLFNNEVIKQSTSRPVPSIETTSSIVFSDNGMCDLEKLKSTVAQDPDILDVVDVASEWWPSWRDQQWAVREQGADPTVRAFVKSRLDSTDPVVYATGLMCIAMSLHRIRPGLDDIHLHLSATPFQLFDRIVTAIDQVVLSRQPQGAAGILLALQRAKTHAEGDQLRKAWLRTRHAILLSQHLNFANDSSAGQEELVYRQRWIGSIFEMDHFLSLVLGFPHARDANFSDKLAQATLLQPTADLTLKMRALRRILAITAGKINDRNARQEQPSSASTCTVLNDMRRYAAAMPAEWWECQHHADSMDMRLAHEHLMTQLWFWEIQAFLHLPHMLQTDGSFDRYNQSRNLCLQGCREMLKVFCILRGTPALSVYVCSCEDFQGVITSTMLLVGILLGIPHGIYPTTTTLDEDYAILDEVKDIFRYRGLMQGGSISRQGLRVIETLESFLLESSGDESGMHSRSIVLPYFGLIQIESKFPMLPATSFQLGQLDLNAPLTERTSAEPMIEDFTLPAGLETDPDGLLFEDSSPQLSEGSNTTHSTTNSDNTTNKVARLPTKQTDFNPPQINMDDMDSWDQFLYGSELAQDWDLPDWRTTFEDWNGAEAF